MTTSLPDVADPDRLTDALRRHGVLFAGRVRDVAMDTPVYTLVSRIVRLRLAYEGLAEKAPDTLILKIGKPGMLDPTEGREVQFYNAVAPATPTGLLLRCFDAEHSPHANSWHLLLEDVTDSHRVATQWPLPPTEQQCRMIVGVLARFHAAWWDVTKGSVSVVAPHDPVMRRDIYQRLEGFCVGSGCGAGPSCHSTSPKRRGSRRRRAVSPKRMSRWSCLSGSVVAGTMRRLPDIPR